MTTLTNRQVLHFAELAEALPPEQADVANAIRKLITERQGLLDVMMAAAVEIDEHWDAHCDDEGYGPVNLMHRLEAGIASDYGYVRKINV